VRKNGRDIVLVADDGLIEVTAHRVAVLTAFAVAADRLDEAIAEEARRRAEARLGEKLSGKQAATLNASLAHALARLRVKQRQRR
jgi:F-type H+-transporting ATPase subunit epsilon